MIKKFSLCLMLLLLGGFCMAYSQETGDVDESSDEVYSQEDSYFDDGENEGLQFDFGGKVESVHGVGFLKNFDYLASRNFVSAFVKMSLYGSSAKISATAEYNYPNKERTGFRLNEAYYKYSNSLFELCVGRQHIVWGQADGFTLTNVIAAKDSREITSVTNDDSLLPSDGIRVKFFHDIFTFDAMVIPFFTPNKLPSFSFELGKNKPPLYINLPTEQKVSGFTLPISYKKDEAKTPRHVLDTEMGMRFSFFLPRIDFSFSAFYGWDKNPMFVRKGVLNTEKKMFPHPIGEQNVPKSIDIKITPEYYRIAMLGTDGAIPIGDVLVRYEAAYIWGRHFEPKSQIGELPKYSETDTTVAVPFNKPLRKHQLLMLAGLDWNKSGWTLSTQYFEDLILDHKDDIARPLHQGTISLNLSKSFLRETLKASITGAIGVNYGDTFSTYSIDYAITDNFHVATGFDIYTKGKDGKGQFSQMKDLSTYWLRGRFSF
ncbi:MAG: DUF1302 family protein [Treponema sp.]